MLKLNTSLFLIKIISTHSSAAGSDHSRKDFCLLHSLALNACKNLAASAFKLLIAAAAVSGQIKAPTTHFAGTLMAKYVSRQNWYFNLTYRRRNAATRQTTMTIIVFNNKKKRQRTTNDRND